MDKQLILKYLQGNSTSEESRILENWITSSEENTNFFNQIKSEFIIDSFDSASDGISIDAEYSKFKNKYISQKPSLIKRLRPVMKYAAIFILLISASYFLYNYNKNSGSSNIQQNEITLQLENGEAIVVDENGSTKISNAKGTIVGEQKGNKLVYSTSNPSNNLEFNTLTVPYGKTFELQLSDGTTAYLNAGSSIKYPVQFSNQGNREVVITGEAYLDVAKDANHPFVVNAGDLNVRVLGTQFNVYAYPNDKISEVVLVEGSVGIYGKNEEFEVGKTAILEPGNMASFDKISKGIEMQAVQTEMHTSWMRGELIFRNETFINILKKLERHYNVQFVVKNEELSKERYNATFITKSPIEEIMQNLNINYGIDFEIDGAKITIE